VKHGVAVGADGAKILDRVKLIFVANLAQGLQVMNVYKAFP